MEAPSLSPSLDGDKKGRKVEEAILETDRKKDRASQLDDRCPAGLIDDAKLLHWKIYMYIRKARWFWKGSGRFLPVHATESEFRWW